MNAKAIGGRYRNYLFASLLTLSLAAPIAVITVAWLFMTPIVTFVIFAAVAVGWLAAFVFSLFAFGRSALFMLFGAPLMLMALWTAFWGAAI